MTTTITRTETQVDGLDAIVWAIGDIAELTVHAASGLILSVEVDEDHRGQGLARRLYETAASEMDVYHVPAWGCTDEGAAFAEAMGGEVMDDEQAAAIVGMDLSIYDAA